MFRDLKRYVNMPKSVKPKKRSLVSRRRPIVLLQSKRQKTLAPGISAGLNTIGAMLPYLPFHYLLFNELPIPAIVLTSGNISDEPILIDDQKSHRYLSSENRRRTDIQS